MDNLKLFRCGYDYTKIHNTTPPIFSSAIKTFTSSEDVALIGCFAPFNATNWSTQAAIFYDWDPFLDYLARFRSTGAIGSFAGLFIAFPLNDVLLNLNQPHVTLHLWGVQYNSIFRLKAYGNTSNPMEIQITIFPKYYPTILEKRTFPKVISCEPFRVFV